MPSFLNVKKWIGNHCSLSNECVSGNRCADLNHRVLCCGSVKWQMEDGECGEHGDIGDGNEV